MIIQQNINQLEKKIQNKYNELQQKYHEDFIKTSNKYDNNTAQKQLFRHLERNNHDNIIFNNNNNKLFDDDEIMQELEEYYDDLYGSRSKIYNESCNTTINKINKIIEDSYKYDDNQYNKEFTLSELHCALKSFANSKACGLDFIPYKIIKILCKDYYLSTFCKIINPFTIICLPRSTTYIQTILLKKPVVNTFDKLRGINITNNIKNIINKMSSIGPNTLS